MGLKNYTTSIPTEKTIAEIETILALHEVSDIWKQYDGAANITGINFIVNTEFGKMPFKLPMNAQAVSQVLKNQKKAGQLGSLPWKQADDINHARKVGWRILKDWIDAQMAIIDLELVKIEQVFLPYAYDYSRDRTLYDALKEKRFKGMLMEAKEEVNP